MFWMITHEIFNIHIKHLYLTMTYTSTWKIQECENIISDHLPPKFHAIVTHYFTLVLIFNFMN